LNAVAEPACALPSAALRDPRPSFVGAVGGELLKLRRQRSIYVMLSLALLLFLMLSAAFFTADNFKATMERSPATFVGDLIGVTAASVGRSLAIGIGAALALFPVDNFGVLILNLLHTLTGWQLWLQVSAYLLGPNMNVLPVVMETGRGARAAFATPLVKVDATHAWLVMGAWAIAMIAVTVTLVKRRDVMQ
jgi:ABC-2 type transport system permease protein